MTHPNEQLAREVTRAVLRVIEAGGDNLLILNAVRVVLEVEPKDTPKQLKKLRSILNAKLR
jgi:hypothetical protein